MVNLTELKRKTIKTATGARTPHLLLSLPGGIYRIVPLSDIEIKNRTWVLKSEGAVYVHDAVIVEFAGFVTSDMAELEVYI